MPLLLFVSFSGTDIQNSSIPFHNLSAGGELDVNIPFVNFGISASAMFSFRYLENKIPNILEDYYPYLYTPFNFKWRFGPKVFRAIIAAGPYALIPLSKEVKNTSGNDSSTPLLGMNIQLGGELLSSFRLSVGYRTDTFTGNLEDFIKRFQGFYLDVLWLF